MAGRDPKFRNREGRYDIGFDRMCICGHTLGQHGDPDIPASRRACVQDMCECEGFKPMKKPRQKNPGRRSVHTAKWDRCVKEVGGSARSAAAVCTATIGYRGSFKAGHRRKNPSDHSIPKAHRAYYIAERADKNMQRQLVRVYGPKIASEMRYQPSKWKDPKLIAAGRQFDRARRVLHSVWDEDKRRRQNPLPQLTSIRRIFYAVSATKGREHLYLKRNGKLTRSKTDAARFATVKEATARANAHLRRFPASRAYRFQVGLVY